MEKNENICGFPFTECRISFASPPIGLSQRPMKLNVGVSAGQCRPESIYLHTSTVLVEQRLWASYILVSLKSLLHQTWVNGLLMDTQRQVLFLWAGALDKKPKATAWLKAVVQSTAESGGASSDKFQYNFLLDLFASGRPAFKPSLIQFKGFISLEMVGDIKTITINVNTIYHAIILKHC